MKKTVLPDRRAHPHGRTCHIAIPRDCIGRIYKREYNPKTGTIVLTPKERAND